MAVSIISFSRYNQIALSFDLLKLSSYHATLCVADNSTLSRIISMSGKEKEKNRKKSVVKGCLCE